MKFKLSMMPKASIILFGLYLLISALNIYFAFIENEKYRKITKPFCLASLIASIVIWQPSYPFLYIALIFDWIGDVLLIWKKKLKIFLLGTISFLLGHVFFAVQALSFFGNKLDWTFYLVVIFLTVIGNYIAYPYTKKVTRKGLLSFGANLYFSCLVFLLVIYFAGCFVGYTNYLLIAALGMIAFICSDLTIIYTKFVKKFHRQEFVIMSLYLIAQGMIALGFCMTFSTII